MSLLDEIEKAQQYPKFYWEDRDTDQVIGGYGAHYTTSEIPQDPTDFLFGGSSFCKNLKDTVWHDIPSSFYFHPKVLLSDHKREITHSSASLKHLKKTETPTFHEWSKLIHHALESIEHKALEKVVLARRTSLSFKETLNPFHVLKHLKSKNSRAIYFLLQFSEDTAFVGATPEKLYARQGRTILSEALAATCHLNASEEALKTPKSQLEFLIVKQFIHAQLAPICESLQWEEYNRIVKTSTVQHLYNQLTATLKNGISDHHLIPLLHPTPAIAGSPQLAALLYLHQKEPFDRGWYASPIGWLEKEKADIAIGIRSCLIRGKEMHLFAGAGIIRDSTAESEWEELNHKISQFAGL